MASRGSVKRALSIIAVRALAIAVALTTWLPAASAQDDAYRRLAEDATRAMAERRLPEALTLFREMHAMAPSARTLWSLGRVHYELAEYVVALDYLDQALADPRRPLEGAPRDETSALRDRALALIGEIEVEVTPAEATVLLDDVVARERRVRLDPGEHVLRFELAGHEPAVRRVIVRGGERETLSVALAPVAVAMTAGGVPGGARDVTIHVRTLTPGLRLHLQPLATSGTPGPIGPMELACEAPCEHTLRSGVFSGAVSRGEGPPALALGTVELLSDATLEIEYRDETGTRTVGTTVAVSMVALGVAGIVLGSVMLERDGPLPDQGWGIASLTVGVVLAALGLPMLAFVVSPDFAEIRAVSR